MGEAEPEEQLERALRQLTVKKEATNADVDLTGECNSIIELDNRLSSLLGQVRSLRSSTGAEDSFIGTACDKLEPNYSQLAGSMHQFQLCSALQKLNRLCKQINTNPIFAELSPAGGGGGDQARLGRRSRQGDVVGGEEPAGEPASACKYGSAREESGGTPGPRLLATADTELAGSLVMEFADEFEAAYGPLECLLAGRPDLPYRECARQLRALRADLSGPRRPSGAATGSCD